MINYYKLYGLSPSDDFKTIKKVLKALQQKYEKEINLGENVPALQSQLDILIEAMGTLLDPEAREVYDEELVNCPPSDIKDPFADAYFDYGSIRTSDLETWQEISNFSGEINVDVYRSLLQQSTVLPYPEIQEDVVLSMILTPSAMSNMLPICFGFGIPGSGKSQLSNLISRIWGGTPLIGTTSFATLRRYVGSISTAQHNSKTFCLNNAVCWDDISPQLMRNEHTFSLIKSATNRATSIYRMPKSQTDLEMLEIQTFGQRALSSIYPFFADPEFVELNRRMLIVECKRSKEAVNTIDFETIDWSGLKIATNNYWSSKAQEYANMRKKVVRYNRTHRAISPERFALCTDLLTTGMTIGVWGELSNAVDALLSFYASNDALVDTFGDPLKIVLLKTISVTAKNEIATNVIKDVVTTALKTGLIDRQIKAGDITRMMRTLGWDLDVMDRVWRKTT